MERINTPFTGGYNSWSSNLSVRVLTVTPEGTASYTGGSVFTAQT